MRSTTNNTIEQPVEEKPVIEEKKPIYKSKDDLYRYYEKNKSLYVKEKQTGKEYTFTISQTVDTDLKRDNVYKYKYIIGGLYGSSIGAHEVLNNYNTLLSKYDIYTGKINGGKTRRRKRKTNKTRRNVYKPKKRN